MRRLHYAPGNASMAPHTVLRELDAPFELVRVDREHGAHKSPAYLRLNPNGLIPVLEEAGPAGEDGLVLYETVAILLHLADTHPAAGLLPPVGTTARAHAYKWLTWMTNTLQAMLLHYFYPERLADDAAGAAAVRRHAEARIGPMLDQLDAELARHGGPWLLGDAYSVADPMALMLCRWTRGFARPARSLPALGPYLQRMLARPAVRRVFEVEGLVGAAV